MRQTTVELSEHDIRDAVAEYIQKLGYKPLGRVKLALRRGQPLSPGALIATIEVEERDRS